MSFLLFLLFSSAHYKQENGSYFFLTRQLQSPLYWSADSSRPAGQDRYQLFWGWGVNAALLLFKEAFHMVDGALLIMK